MSMRCTGCNEIVRRHSSGKCTICRGDGKSGKISNVTGFRATNQGPSDESLLSQSEIDENMMDMELTGQDLPMNANELFAIHKCNVCGDTKVIVRRLGRCMMCLDIEYKKLVTRAVT